MWSSRQIAHRGDAETQRGSRLHPPLRLCASAVEILFLFMLAGCTPPVKRFDLVDQPLSCDDANRTAYDTLRAMGFQITTFDPATPGHEGTLKGTTTEGSTAGADRSATVTIECTPTGATVIASEDGKWLRQLDFKHAYYLGFTSQLAMAKAQRERAAKLAAGELPASQQRNDLQVLVEPVGGLGAKLDFDLDLAAAGVLPVRINIKNPSDRTYRLGLDEIRLTRSDRERVASISPEQAAERIVSAHGADKDGSLTTLSQQAVAERLRAKLLTANTLGPHAEVKGYLYFPLGDYTRARVVLTEQESDESEGFVVEF